MTMGMLNISPAMLRNSALSNTAGGAVPLGIPIMSMCACPDNTRLCSNEYHRVSQRAPGPPLQSLREVRPEALCDLVQRGAGARVPPGGEGHVEDVRLARVHQDTEAAG